MMARSETHTGVDYWMGLSIVELMEWMTTVEQVAKESPKPK
jgi:hypothetical protein